MCIHRQLRLHQSLELLATATFCYCVTTAVCLIGLCFLADFGHSNIHSAQHADPAIRMANWVSRSGVGEATDRSKQATEEYEVIARLKPDDLDNRLAWAKACLKAKQPDQARRVLEKLLELDGVRRRDGTVVKP